MECSFAWLGTFWQLAVRYERYALINLGFFRLGSILLLLRHGGGDPCYGKAVL